MEGAFFELRLARSGVYVLLRDLLVDETHLYVGGQFKTVDGLSRKNFTRFPFITP